jgi:hypothetical protein
MTPFDPFRTALRDLIMLFIRASFKPDGAGGDPERFHTPKTQRIPLDPGSDLIREFEVAFTMKASANVARAARAARGSVTSANWTNGLPRQRSGPGPSADCPSGFAALGRQVPMLKGASAPIARQPRKILAMSCASGAPGPPFVREWPTRRPAPPARARSGGFTRSRCREGAGPSLWPSPPGVASKVPKRPVCVPCRMPV